MFFSTNSAVGCDLLWAVAPSRALWSLLRFERGLGTISDALKPKLFPVHFDISLDKARAAALGLWPLEVVLLADCCGSLSSRTGRCPRKEGRLLKWQRKPRQSVNGPNWTQLFLLQSWVLRAQKASSGAWSLPSKKRCFSGITGSKSHCLFREMMSWWLLTTSPCSSWHSWRSCAARACATGETWTSVGVWTGKRRF